MLIDGEVLSSIIIGVLVFGFLLGTTIAYYTAVKDEEKKHNELTERLRNIR